MIKKYIHAKAFVIIKNTYFIQSILNYLKMKNGQVLELDEFGLIIRGTDANSFSFSLIPFFPKVMFL